MVRWFTAGTARMPLSRMVVWSRSVSLMSSTLEPLSRLPRLDLGFLPTPLRRIQLPGRPWFWCKDDGVCPEDLYGGNKLRKLEYLLADARGQDKGHLVVLGDAESHGVLATGILGTRQGFRGTAVLVRWGQPREETDCASLLKRLGVEIRGALTPAGAVIRTRRLLRDPDAYEIPIGGSNWISTTGYVRAIPELEEQLRSVASLPAPERIYVAMGSGGTMAGLLIGLAVSGVPSRLVATRTASPVFVSRHKVRRLLSRTVSCLGLPDRIAGAAWDRLDRIDRRSMGRGFRDVTAEAQRAMITLSDLSLEPIFSGKSAATLLRDLDSATDGQLLLWNTHSMTHRLWLQQSSP
jgi:1-aminocyclopropane-1-carboxylate deaminase/D-cysteine desulfhydrase-like pyridoxal-dependent ACC family enzyme